MIIIVTIYVTAPKLKHIMNILLQLNPIINSVKQKALLLSPPPLRYQGPSPLAGKEDFDEWFPGIFHYNL